MIKLIIRILILLMIVFIGVVIEDKMDLIGKTDRKATTYTTLTDGCTYKNLIIVPDGFEYEEISCPRP